LLLNQFFSLISIFAVFFLYTVITSGCTKKQVESRGGMPLLYESDLLEDFERDWILYPKDCWDIDDSNGRMTLRLFKSGRPRKLRAPRAYAVMKNFRVSDFIFEGKVKSLKQPTVKARDMIIVFGYIDSTHFYYVHFSGKSDDKHNIIAIVNGKDREKINIERTDQIPARLTDMNFHDFKVTFNSETAKISAYLDDMEIPLLTAVDSTFRSGMVGIGSMDDIGCVYDVKLWGRLNDR
jgi:translation initiation factor IF-1